MPDQLHGPPTGEIVLGFWALVQTKSKHKVDVAHGILSVLNLMQVWLEKGWSHLKLSECFVIEANCSEGNLRCLSYVMYRCVMGDINNHDHPCDGHHHQVRPAWTTLTWWSITNSIMIVTDITNTIWNLRSVQVRQASTTLQASTVLSSTCTFQTVSVF